MSSPSYDHFRVQDKSLDMTDEIQEQPKDSTLIKKKDPTNSDHGPGVSYGLAWRFLLVRPLPLLSLLSSLVFPSHREQLALVAP